MQYKPLKNEFDISITLDQILKFIYSNNQLEINSKKRTSYIDLGEWFEFKSKLELDLFKTFLNLYLESAIDLKIDWIWNDNQIENKELKLELNKYIFEDDRNFLIRKLFKIETEYNYLEIYDNWEEISKIIKKHDWFDISIIVRWFEFFDLFFRKITEYKWYEDLNKSKVINNLFENISNKLAWEINSSKEIEIFYELDNYLENNRLIFPLLKELEKSNNLVINKIILKNNYLFFYLDKFIDFKKSLIQEKLKNIIKENKIIVEYKNDSFYINNEEIKFKSKKSKIYNLYKIIFDTFNYYKKSNISYEEIQNVFDLNKYEKIEKDFFSWLKYDENIRKDLEIKNKEIEKKYNLADFIGCDKAWIQCQSYKSDII